MTRPVTKSVAEELYAALPPRWTQDDASNGWVLLQLCRALTEPGMQRLADSALDKADGTPGWAGLFTLSTATAQQVRYLGQFVGVHVPQGLTAKQGRALLNSRPGYARGRPATILAAVKDTLTGSKAAALTERTTSPWQHTLRIWRSQTPDENAVRSVLAQVTPAGDIITIELVDGPSYADIFNALPAGNKTYGARKSMFPTYGDIKEYTP